MTLRKREQTLDQKIDRIAHRIDSLWAWGIKRIPDENLPLVDLEVLPDFAKLLIEKRLKSGPKHL